MNEADDNIDLLKWRALMNFVEDLSGFIHPQNESQFLQGSWPQFSPCFQSVCFVWAPCGVLYVTAPCYFLWLCHRHVTMRLPFSRLSAAKLICQMSANIATLVLLLRKSGQMLSAVPSVEMVTDVIKFVSFIMLAMLGQYERKQGVTSSLFQFFFWTIFTLGQIIPAYTMVTLEIHNEDLMKFLLFYLTFGLCLILVFLNCWSEHPGLSATRRGYLHIDDRDPCPLEAASALSSLTFSWIYGLLKSGSKNEIDDSTMWSVPPSMSSDEVSSRFEEVWRKELDLNCGESDPPYGMRYSRVNDKDFTGYSTSDSSTNSSNGKVSKDSALENVMYSERTRLTGNMESFQARRYTECPQHSSGLGVNHFKKDIKRGHRPSLLRALWVLYRMDIVHVTVYRLLGATLTVLVPLILNYLLVYLQSEHHRDREWLGYGLCLLMLLASQWRCVLDGRCHLLAITTGLSVKTALAAAVYKKALLLKSNKKEGHPVIDEIVHVITIDCQRMQEFMARLGHVMATPLLVLMTVAVMYRFMAHSAIVGVSCLVLLVPIRVLVILVRDDIQHKKSIHRDIRLRVLREIFHGIKTLKLFAWEQPFQSKVQAIRYKEMTSLLKISYCHVVSGIMENISVFLVSFITMATYILSDPSSVLDSGTVFMMLAYVSCLKRPLEGVAGFVNLSVESYKACLRIQAFLLQQELDQNAVAVTPGAEYPVMIEKGRMTWSDSSLFKLKNINLTVPQGTLMAIVGQEGCGKSSLLAAILGEMETVQGKITRKGTVAYVPQEPWIQNCSVLDNIIFGKTYRERKVKAVMAACQLEEDLAEMGADEDTVIGNHGLHLSTSQKQRVSLARAVYHDCDLYLLDGPLCQLDGGVGKAVFGNVLGPKGLLKNTTRIMVTESVHILPAVDTIVVMDQGRIVEVGSYDQLTEHDGAFAQFLKERLMQERFYGRDDEENDEIASIKDDMWGRVERLTSDYAATTSGDEGWTGRERKNTFTSRSVQDKNVPLRESRRLGDSTLSFNNKVPFSVFKKFIQSIGLTSMVFTAVMLMFFHAANVLGYAWLGQWTCDLDIREPVNENNTVAARRDVGNEFYLSVYSLYGIGTLIFLGCFHYMFWTSIVRTSRRIHGVMVERLLRAPLAFFDTTPLEYLMSTCSNDIKAVDDILPLTIRDIMTSAVGILSVLTVIVWSTPWFAAVILPTVGISLGLFKVYSPTARQLRHMTHSSQSPVDLHFSDTLRGSQTIRAFNESDRFIKEFHRRLDYNHSYNFGINIAYRWVSLHLTTLSNILVFIASSLQVMYLHTHPGLAGLAIFYALQLSPLLVRVISSITDLQTGVASLEKIQTYSEVPQEIEWVIPDSRPPATWPFPGRIEFHQPTRANKDGVTQQTENKIRINGGEKIGVVSRSMRDGKDFLAEMFRLSATSNYGTISIDGLDISSVGLHDLRSKLTVLPKEAVLFSGSLRFNLDPLREFKDDEIWSSLSRVHIKPFVAQLAEQLDFDVGEKGEHLSIGHRQLICLARTLLRKTSVVVIEAPGCDVTTGDFQTEFFVHNVAGMAFQKCTVVTIASLPQSVVSCDRVLVLDNGLVKEFDSPATLLRKPSSSFYSMAAEAGLI